MRFLYKSDTHGTAKTPSGRLDFYPLAILKKLYETGKIIKDNYIDFVIDGGDLFHSAKISLKYAGEMARIMKSWGVPIYVIPGSHDVYDYNYDNISNTMLGMFENSGVVKVLKKGEPLIIKVGELNLIIEGQEHLNRLTNNKSDIFKMTETGDLNILVVHDMLVDKPMPPGVECYLLKDIKTNADIVLSGHYHPGHNLKVYNDVFFYNPGSFGRIEYREEKPQVILFEVEELDNELVWFENFIELKNAKPANEIFDLTKKQIHKDNQKIMEDFKQSLQFTKNLKSNRTIDEMIEDIALENNIDNLIVDLAREYINSARQNNDEEDAYINGFVEKPYRIYITDVEIENFQSHEDTKVSFVDGLNALVGESNYGKTSVFRAIKWALMNEPKGINFIRTGTDKARVRVYFSDGSFVERERTKKDAGVFRVRKVDGSINEYVGFNNEVPIDVINTHQMPEVVLSKDTKTVLNIQDQLDGPFFLKESPANRAAIIGRLIGVEHVDIAIKEVSKDSLGLSKEVRLLDADIKRYNKDLERYTDLYDKKLVIDYVDNLVSELSGYEKERDTLIDYNDKLLNAKKDILSLDTYLKKLPNEKLLDIKIKKVEKLYDTLKVLTEMYEALEETKSIKFKLTKIINSIPDIDFNKVLDKAKEKINTLETLVSFREERLIYYKEQKKHQDILNKFNYIDEIDTLYNFCIDELETANTIVGLSDELDKTHGEVNISQVKVSKALKEYNLSNDEHEKLTRDFTRFLTEVGTCPLCGSPLSSEHMHHIIES